MFKQIQDTLALLRLGLLTFRVEYKQHLNMMKLPVEKLNDLEEAEKAP